MKPRPELNVAEVIAMIFDIEHKLCIQCLSYGLYDKSNKEYITMKNKDVSYDYSEAYDNRCKYRYTHSSYLTDDIVVYLLKHHGELYFPMLKKNTQKAYVAQFNVTELISKYGENYSVTPDTYFQQNFCWETKKKKYSKQCEGQLVLPFLEME